MTSPITPGHDNLFAVEELVTFRNVQLIRAPSAHAAIERFAADDGSMHYFQQHVSSVPFLVTAIVEDADIVGVLRSTEQPNITLEEFTMARDTWLQNCVNE